MYILIKIGVYIVLSLGCGMLVAWKTGLLSRKTPFSAILAILAVAAASYIGATKPPTKPKSNRVAHFVHVLSNGQILEPDSIMGRAVMVAAAQMALEEAEQLTVLASNTLAQVTSDYHDLTNQLANADYSVAYVGYDYPRGIPSDPNHNITITIERTEPCSNNCNTAVYAYFSLAPQTNVTLHLQASIKEGEWITLPVVSSSWPDTTEINGVPCYRYEYTIPEGMRGVPLRPYYDVSFGGYELDEYLNVPEAGVIVTVDNIDYAPFTGWDNYGKLKIRYVGGIAVEAIAHGTNYTGRVEGVITL